MRIKEISISNFKSFKKANIQLSEGITAIMGPNGSGKSNIIDAVMFALGETSLSKLRAEKLENLVNKNSKVASVSLMLCPTNGKEEYVITRQIRRDGKTRIMLNGKKIKIKELKHFLVLNGIGNIRNAIIPQGEIQKIVKMKPKERKQYLEELAETAVYTIKRAEAMKELEIVNGKIREINLILGEKLNMLNQLEQDIKKMSEYESLLKERNDIKGTIIKMQHDSISATLKMQEKEIDEKEKEKAEIEKNLNYVLEKINEIDKQRESIDKELIRLRERDELFKELEKKKAEIKIIEANISHLEEKKEELNNALTSIEQEISVNADKLVELSNIKISEKEQEEISIIASIDQKIDELNQAIEEKRAFLNDVSIKKERLETLKTIKIDKIEGQEINIEGISKKLNEAINKEKEINARLIAIDNELISLREKYALVKASASLSQSNAYLFIEELRKTNKINGIFGRVIDLIDFPEHLTSAVDAAGGNRLSYIVVSDSSVAKEIIEMLKKNQLGRVTFLPIKEMNIKKDKENPKAIINFIEYSPAYEQAIIYTFGTTILAESFNEAKELAKKYDRVVTLSGELFEKSGAITGGASKSSLASSKYVEEISKKIEALKEEKASLLNTLNSIRETINELRFQKAKAQAKEEEIKLREEQIKRQNEIIAEIKAIEEWLKNKNEEIEKSKEFINNAHSMLEKLKEEKKKAEEMFKQEIERKAELKMKIKMQIEEKANLEINLARLNEKKQALINSLNDIEKELRRVNDAKLLAEASITSLEDEVSRKYKEFESFIEQLKELDAKQQEYAKQKSELEKKLNSIEKSINSIEIARASTKERLNIINQELAKMGAFTFISDKSISYLEQRLNEIENSISKLGDINFSAKSLYEQMEKGVNEIKERVDKLKEEKNAVINMISEIDKKKKQAFMQAFNVLNEKFKEMIKYIKGFESGELILKGDDPDNAELHIIIYQDGKPIYIDSLAGGEKTLVSLFFLYSINSIKQSGFYIFDEADAALDKVNCERMIEFLKTLSKRTQFIIISHRDPVISKADSIIGVSKVQGFSKAVMLSLNDVKAY